MAKDQVINVRVSVEEKAALKKAAGAGGIGPYLRALGLAQANGTGPRTSVPKHVEQDGLAESGSAGLDADSGSEGRDSAAKALPARDWRARVRQLTASGVPRPAAERIADLELQGVR